MKLKAHCGGKIKTRCGQCGRSIKQGSRPYEDRCFKCLKPDMPGYETILSDLIVAMVARSNLQKAEKQIRRNNSKTGLVAHECSRRW